MYSIRSNIGSSKDIVRIWRLERPNEIATRRIRPEDGVDTAIRSDNRLQTRFELSDESARVGKYRCAIQSQRAKMVVGEEVKLIGIAVGAEDNFTIIHNVSVVEFRVGPTQCP